MKYARYEVYVVCPYYGDHLCYRGYSYEKALEIYNKNLDWTDGTETILGVFDGKVFVKLNTNISGE